MRIGCLQFAPRVGDVDNNLNRADSVLNGADPADLEDLDILVLPEMAFTGYNFKSLQEIMPFLEPAGSGISALWARTTALKYDCKIAVGYPEKVDVSSDSSSSSPLYYNSLLLVNEDGETLANYRKQHLFYTDETWALEGSGGFFQGEVPGLGQTAMGICMDINPYKFEAPWHEFEFSFHVLDSNANVVIISMAWSTLDDRAAFCSKPYDPDMATLQYWAQRMEPLIRAEREDEIILIFANRCGIEGDALYAGTSAVMGIRDGEVNVYGVLPRGTRELLVVDTDDGPFAKLVSRPGRAAKEGEYEATEDEDVDMDDSDHIKEPPAPAEAPVEATKGGDIGAQASPSTICRESSGAVATPPDHAAEESAKASPQGSPRADSPVLSPSRPHLTISTEIASPSLTRFPQPLGVPRSRVALTPPATGDFPSNGDDAYQEAVQQDQLQSALPNIYTPEEPQWPAQKARDVRPASPSRNPETTATLVKDAAPAGGAPEQERTMLSPPRGQAEVVVLPTDACSERGTHSYAEEEVMAAMPPAPTAAGEFPPTLVNAADERRKSGASENSISIGMEGGKDMVVVQLRDPSAQPHPYPPHQVVTVTFSR